MKKNIHSLLSLSLVLTGLALTSCDRPASSPLSPSASTAPTTAPTGTPTTAPTAAATGTPTTVPTAAPTGTPTAAPTAAPTGTPTAAPTAAPTGTPTTTPTVAPTTAPTTSPVAEFMQVERLGRPAINEGLLITNNLLNTWNMVSPTVDLTSAAKPIADEATSVLKALGNKDDEVAGLFKALLPDVMRIDTTRVSGYAGSAPGKLDNVTKDLRPIGGRMLKDDVIDVTLSLVVPGGAPSGTAVEGLESDNVTYDGPNANGTSHKPLLSEFPYLAAPN